MLYHLMEVKMINLQRTELKDNSKINDRIMDGGETTSLHAERLKPIILGFYLTFIS